MGIDSGQNIVFSAGFPLPNVDQSSQQFRDNFAIIKTAVERLQIMHSDANSIVALAATMSGADVILTGSYKDNGLVLPIGDPGTPLTGMIRYDPSTGIQFYNGSGWRSGIFKDAAGLVTLSTMTITTKLTLGYSPTLPTDAVPLSYVTGQFAIANSALSSLAGALSTEETLRANADTALQAEIDNIFVNQDALNDLANTVGMFGSLIDNAVADSANASADAANALTTATFTANALNQEITDRIANDAMIRSDFAYAISNTSITDHGGVSNVYTVANNVVGLSALLANATGSDANAVQKTGDTMSGQLTINNNLIVADNANIGGDLFVGGQITAVGEITSLSDVTIKYDIRTIENALDKVDMLRGTYFKRADIAGNPEQIGVIAQEMQEIMPQVVHEQTNGLLSVAYGNLAALLIEAVKELRAEIEDIKDRLPPKS
jgi:ACT domain-containing protein